MGLHEFDIASIADHFAKFNDKEWRAIGILILFSSTLSAGIVGAFQFLSHRFSRKVALSNLYVEFSSRYNRQEMHQAIVALTDYYKKGPSNVHDRWNLDRQSAEPWVAELKAARRTVERFYLDIAQLYRNGYIRRRFARILSAQWGLNVYFLICVPMERVTSPPHEGNPLMTLKKIRERYGDGKIF